VLGKVLSASTLLRSVSVLHIFGLVLNFLCTLVLSYTLAIVTRKCGCVDLSLAYSRDKNLCLENGRLSDRYCIGTDTGCIISNRIGYCCIGRYYVHHCRSIDC